jgi:AraC-like DNA-binding protein
VERPVFFQYHLPCKALSEFVGLFWYWEGHNVPSSKERILPTGTVELVINLGSDRTSDSVVSGAKSKSVIIERTAQDQLLGIHFKPGGTFPFLGFPFDEIHNIDITLADFCGENESRQLLDRLHEAQSVDLKFQILQNWLIKIAKRPLQHHRAVKFALEQFQRKPGVLSTAELAEKTGFSQRRFIQIFKNEVGLTPKLFSRVQRFQSIIETIARREKIDWLDLSLENGYFDQAHFNHDFQEFSGLTPRNYMSLRTEHLHHVRAPD